MPRLHRAPLATLGLAAVGPLLLAGCDKPSPGVTVFAGHKSHRADASCWSHKAATPVDQPACGGGPTNIRVGGGDTLGISVDKAIADAGWRVQIGDQAVTPTTLKSTYFKLPVGSGIGDKKFPLTIVALDKSGQAPRGVWKFQLVAKS